MQTDFSRRGLAVVCCVAAGLLAEPGHAAGHVDSSSIEEAKAFLRHYVRLSAAPNGELLALYSERAVVRARAADHPTDNVFQGSAYKQWGLALVLSRKAVLDASVFKDATVERRAGRLVIRARRYAINRCYWDGNYLLGIEREAGQWRIVEERMTTQPQASCSAAQAQADHSLHHNNALNVAVGRPGVSRDGALATVPSGVNVNAVSSLQVPIAAAYPQLAPTSPQQQADLAMRMALQMAGRSQGTGAAPNPAIAATPFVVRVPGATPTVTQTLLVTPPPQSNDKLMD